MEIGNNKKGFALLAVMLLMFLMFSVAFYFLDFSMVEQRMADSQKRGAKAYHLAEAGLNEMFWQLKNNENYKNDFRTKDSWTKTITGTDVFGEGTGSYSVTIRNSQKGKGEITATGTIPVSDEYVAQRVVKSKVFQALNPDDDGDSTSTFDIHDSALFAEEKIAILHSKININGSIHSNKDVKVNGHGTKVSIGKDLEAVGEFSKSFASDVEVAGEISDSKDHSPPPPKLDMPTVSFDNEDPMSFKKRADKIYSEKEFEKTLKDADGSAVFGDASSSVIIYVTGDVSLDQDTNLTIYGALIVEGGVRLGDGSGPKKLFCGGEYTSLSINYVDGYPAGLIAKDDIKFGFCLRSSNIDGVIYAGKKMDIMNFTDSVDINGGIFGKDIRIFSVWNDMAMKYDEDIVGYTLYPTEYAPIIKMDHWEEEY
ncbi:MAG: hypothetical protein ACOCVY_00780 [Patescibacteria group bacterium]